MQSDNKIYWISFECKNGMIGTWSAPAQSPDEFVEALLRCRGKDIKRLNKLERCGDGFLRVDTYNYWLDRFRVMGEDAFPIRPFVSKPSARYLKAVKVLRELLHDANVDLVKRAYAEAIWASKAHLWRRDLRGPGDGHVCVSRLKGESCPDGPESICESAQAVIPGSDHLSEWCNDDETVAIVSQPYQMTFDALERTILFCEKNGLTVQISGGDSWHFPDATLVVEYRRANND